jgi:hypothetical protein
MDQQVLLLWKAANPAIDVKTSGEWLRLGQAKRQRVELAEISLGH